MSKPETTKIKAGDWISFMRDSRLLIGEVRYIRESLSRHRDLYTAVGMIAEDCVLEVRSGKA
jgi:hypothetical protein